MFGNVRKKEEVCDVINSAVLTSLSTEPLVSSSFSAWQQKPSPVSGDDVTKPESSNTQTTQDGTGTNVGKYARKKSGIKPIRPSGFSASSLNPTTPGKLSVYHPTTPGKLPQTPRMSYFRENELPRMNLHSEFATSKFTRSESTPELHRIKKTDFQSESGNAAQEKANNNYSHILQESNISNLLTLTSDSLPDIFRKPPTAQLDTIQQQQPSKCEEKVSKWGYGPSTNTTSHTPSYNPNNASDGLSTSSWKPSLSPIETPVKSFQPAAAPKPFSANPWAMRPLEKKSFQQNSFTRKPDINESTGDPTPRILNMSLDQSVASDTASALGLSSQLTVKAQPVPLASTVLSTPVPPPAPPISAPSKPPTPPLQESLKRPIYQPKEPLVATKSNSNTQSSTVQPERKILPSPPAPVSAKNQLPPPGSTSRPSGKTKLIAVNGKSYTVMKLLGRGGSSVVYQVLNPEMTEVFALKVVRLDSVDEATAEGYINEVRLLKQLQGLSRVVRLLEFEYNEEEEKLLLVMEKGDTDLATVIRNRSTSNAINSTLVRFYWQEMLESVGEIHDKNVIHTDLKPANFLLVNGGLKLIDFGIATSIQADMTSIMKDSQCGTYNYMAPEAIKSATPVGSQQEYRISRKTDVWSLGCMLYSLIYKNPPFHKIRDTLEKINAIIDDRFVIDFPATADPLVVSVLRGCLDRNPRNRPSIEQLLSHPYLSGSSNTSVGSLAVPSPTFLRRQLDPFMKEDGRLSDEAKEWLRQWM